MKLTINSSELTKALEQAAKFVSAKPLMPILANIKLVATDNLKLTGFNLAHGIEIDCTSEVIDCGSVCIPASAIAIIKSMAGQLIIEVDESHSIAISNLSGKVEIQGMSIEEYPELDSIDSPPESIDAKFLIQAVKCCVQAASTDESKQVLTGVNITASSGNLRAMATDGHRLVIYNMPVSEITKIESVTIPAKSLALVPTNGGQFIQCKFAKSQISIHTGSRSIMRTLDGKYPDAMLLVPKSFSRYLEIDRRELIDALNMMSAISDANNLVEFHAFSYDSKLMIYSKSDGKTGERQITCDFTDPLALQSEEFQIAFNLKYLIDGLKMFDSGRVKISMNDSLQPVIITGVGNDVDLMYLLMPVQIRS